MRNRRLKLIAMMVLSLLISCGDGDSSPTEPSNEPTLSVSPNSPPKGEEIVIILTNGTNETIGWGVEVPWSIKDSNGNTIIDEGNMTVVGSL